MSLGDVAARLGLPVFPCDDNKQPIVETGFKAASTDPARILEMFARSAARLIGVPMGRVSALIAIDIDVDPARNGMTWLNDHASLLPETRTHKTRSGGLHLLFKIPDGLEIRNSASRIAPGVDVRGEGGYIIVPPSPGYHVADDTMPAAMPAWLVVACCRPEPPPQPQPGPRPAPREHGGTRYGLSALERECSAIRAACFGQQENTLNAAALKIGALVGGHEIDEDVALADLLSAGRGMASQGGRPMWTPSEVDAKVRRAFADGLRQPRSAQPPPGANGHAREREREPDGEPDMRSPDKPDSIWIIREGWAETDIPPRPWIARGYLLRGAVTVVSGPGSAGKSSLMVAWLCALVLGFRFNRFHPTEPCRGAFYNVEDDADEQRRRFSAMAQQLGVTTTMLMKNLALIGPSSVGTLFARDPRHGGLMVNTPVMERLELFIIDFRPDVIVLDPFVELHGEEENDNTAIRAVMARFRHLAAIYAMSVVVLHHSRKGLAAPGDPDSLRGASSIVGAARITLTVNTMTEEEAKDLGVSPATRRNHFRLDGAKMNHCKIEEAEWFRRGEKILANEDAVVFAWPWTPPNPLKGTSPVDLNTVLDIIAAAPSDALYSPNKRGGSNKRWVGFVLVEQLDMTEEAAAKVIAAWLKSGLLVKVKYDDAEQRKERDGVTVDNAKRPTCGASDHV